MNFAHPGPIAEPTTTRACDTVPVFARALTELRAQNPSTPSDAPHLVSLFARVDALLAEVARCQIAFSATYPESMLASDHADDLADLLGAFAPPGHVFYHHPDMLGWYGFWENESALYDPDNNAFDRATDR